MLSSSSHRDEQFPNLNTGQPSQSSNRRHTESTAIDSPVAAVCTNSPDINPTTAVSRDLIDDLNESAIRLGTAVFLSATFTATIITAFLSLAGDVIGKQQQTFELAMFFCILTATCNVSNVLVCGRACILAYEHKYSERPGPSINRKEYSEQLDAATRTQQLTLWVQGLGQALFGVAVLYTVWQMIQNRVLVSVIYGFALILQVVVYGVGFWRISWAESMVVPISGWYLHLLRRWRSESGEDVQQ